MPTKTVELIEKEKIIVIVRGVQKEDLIPLANAMYNAGIRLLEVTYDMSGKISDAQTAEHIQMLNDEFAGRMCIGAGTVTTAAQVRLTAEAGGKFIISPNIDADVIKATRELSMISIPGALTPTEAAYAHSLGAHFVKLFPVSSLGPEYVKAIKAPLSGIKLLAVGGIDDTNMADYLKAGVCGFGIGSNIVKKEYVSKKDYAAITQLAKKYISSLKV